MKKTLFTLLISGFCVLQAMDDAMDDPAVISAGGRRFITQASLPAKELTQNPQVVTLGGNVMWLVFNESTLNLGEETSAAVAKVAELDGARIFVRSAFSQLLTADTDVVKTDGREFLVQGLVVLEVEESPVAAANPIPEAQASTSGAATADAPKELSPDRVVQREAKRVEQQVRGVANNAAKAVGKWKF
jgi:hypothetical protein